MAPECFNLRLVERKCFWIVTYDFLREANLNSLFFVIMVHIPWEGPFIRKYFADRLNTIW